MHSTKTLLISVILVAIVAIVADRLIMNNKSDSETTPTPSPTQSLSASTAPVSFTVHYTSQGMSPKVLKIQHGDSVTFINDTASPFWPASDPHPTHTLCPGFDSLRGLNQGEKYELRFTGVKVCTYHNHLDPLSPAGQGTIEIE